MSVKEKMIVSVFSSVEASYKEPNSSTRSVLLNLKKPEGIVLVGTGDELSPNKVPLTDNLLLTKQVTDFKAGSVADLNMSEGWQIAVGGVFSKDGVPPAIDKKAENVQSKIGHGLGSSKMSEAGPSGGGFFPDGLPLVGDEEPNGSVSIESDAEMSDGESSGSGDSLHRRKVPLPGRSSSALQACDFNPADRTERAYRNALERKRRRTFKEGFDTLLQSVMVLEDDGSRTSNAEVLKKTVRFIHSMNRKIEKGRERITSLLHQNALLKGQIDILEESKARKSARRSVATGRKNNKRDKASSFDPDQSSK